MEQNALANGIINKIKEWILDLLMPKKCLGCGKEGLYICKDCESFLSEVSPEYTQDNFISVWEYEGIIEKAIRKIKTNGCYNIIDELVDKAFERIEFNLPEDMVITYVPMWKKKEKMRGFNQSKLIAKALSKRTGRPVMKLIEKTKDNKAQSEVSLEERIDNMRGVFSNIVPKNKDFSSVLLVDDFICSGSTLNECSKVLEESGINNIYFFTFAKDFRK